jgi:probable addiction module antidote protein
MTARTTSVKTTRFDSAEYLDSDEAIGAYLEEALETEDPAFIAHALGTIARARGMAQIAKETGLSRESLYKALSTEGNPEFSTVVRVMKALGLRFSVAPAGHP